MTGEEVQDITLSDQIEFQDMTIEEEKVPDGISITEQLRLLPVRQSKIGKANLSVTSGNSRGDKRSKMGSYLKYHNNKSSAAPSGVPSYKQS